MDMSMMSWLWIPLGLVVLTVFHLERVNQLTRRMNAVDLKLRLVMARVGIEQAMPAWQKIALDPRGKLRAIKAYQDETGATLADAKAAVEKWLLGT